MISHPQMANLSRHLVFRQGSPSVYVIECPACGYEPDEQLIIRPMRCPKCHRFAWHQRPRPGLLVEKLAGGADTATA